MEKQDILVVAIAVVAFAVLALVVLPFLAGQRPGPGPLVTTPVPTTPGASATIPPGKGRPATPTPTASPTPIPTTPWDGSVKPVGFVEQPGGQVTLTPNPTIPQPALQNRTLVSFAQISGTWSGTTENVYVPTPYWVLEYTADPMALPPNAYPLLIVQVFDAEDPNRFVLAPIKQTIYEEPPATPWSVKLFEGKRTYYFKVDTSFIRSYTLTIRVPREYI